MNRDGESCTPAPAANAPKREARTQAGKRHALAAGPSARSVRATFHLPAALVEDAKNAVVTLSGPPVRLTLAGLVRDALTRELQRMRATDTAPGAGDDGHAVFAQAAHSRSTIVTLAWPPPSHMV